LILDGQIPNDLSTALEKAEEIAAAMGVFKKSS
jgi:hypothetical protein